MEDLIKTKMLKVYEEMKNNYHSETMFQHIMDEFIDNCKSSHTIDNVRLRRLELNKKESIERQQALLLKIKEYEHELRKNNICFRALFVK